jgi:hypothetical protein
MRKLALLLSVVGLAAFQLVSPTPASACQHCTVRLVCNGTDCWTDFVCVGPRFPQNAQVSCDATPEGCFMGGEFCIWT